jgi:hypothetical protein
MPSPIWLLLPLRLLSSTQAGKRQVVICSQVCNLTDLHRSNTYTTRCRASIGGIDRTTWRRSGQGSWRWVQLLSKWTNFASNIKKVPQERILLQVSWEVQVVQVVLEELIPLLLSLVLFQSNPVSLLNTPQAEFGD